jgi:hypothetical protein
MIRSSSGRPLEIVGLAEPEDGSTAAVLLARYAEYPLSAMEPIRHGVANMQADGPDEIEREVIAACGRNLRGQIVIGDAAFQALRGRLANLRRAGQAAWDKATTGGLTANASAVVALADITGCLDLLGLYVAELRHETASLRLENERLRDAVRMPKTTTNDAGKFLGCKQ